MNTATAVVEMAAAAVLAISAAGMAAASAQVTAAGADCTPPAVHYRVMHPSATTVARPARSPPAASLAGAPATAAGTARRVIPIGRLKPWAERCPPPPRTGG